MMRSSRGLGGVAGPAKSVCGTTATTRLVSSESASAADRFAIAQAYCGRGCQLRDWFDLMSPYATRRSRVCQTNGGSGTGAYQLIRPSKVIAKALSAGFHLVTQRALPRPEYRLGQPAQQPSGTDQADALLLRLREQLLGNLVFIDDLFRHGIDHLRHLGHCPSFRSGQSQIHRFSDSP